MNSEPPFLPMCRARARARVRVRVLCVFHVFTVEAMPVDGVYRGGSSNFCAWLVGLPVASSVDARPLNGRFAVADLMRQNLSTVWCLILVKSPLFRGRELFWTRVREVRSDETDAADR